MPYNPNIPQPTDQLSVSQGNLLNNFQALATILNPNTGSFTFPVQVSDPTAITSPNDQFQLFSKYNAVDGFYDLYLKYGADTSYPITATNNATPGYTYLPSGIILQWGTTGSFAVPGGVGPTTYPIAFPNACLMVFLTMATPSSVTASICPYVTSKTATQFVANATGTAGATATLTYLAIGY